jgi:hypothetical protein
MKKDCDPFSERFLRVYFMLSWPHCVSKWVTHKHNGSTVFSRGLEEGGIIKRESLTNYHVEALKGDSHEISPGEDNTKERLSRIYKDRCER